MKVDSLPVVKVENLKAYYISDFYGTKRTINAVDEVSFEIYKNEILGIAGESGCGKTTLLKVLLGMVKSPLSIFGGKVLYKIGDEYKNILSFKEDELNSIRWEVVSYIPQGSMSVLNPVRKIKDTFLDFMEAHKPNISRNDFDFLVKEYLKALGLPLEVLNSYPHQLSGGMRQRVTIALSTIFKPKLILADEPTTALDVVVQRGILQLLRRIQREEENTLVVVSHDMGVHARISDRVGIMYAGKMIEIGDTKDVYTNPMHPYTKYLINSLPRIGDKSHRTGVPGSPPLLLNLPAGCRFQERCPEVTDICRKEYPSLVDVGNGHKVACFLVSKGGKSHEL
jgi:peptide/nickel transport system ATP-binding protein